MGMIAFAGSLRGAGDAANKGLSNFQSALTQKMFQEGSQDFLREQADTAHTRARFNIDDERAYTAKREQELYALGRGRKPKEAEEDLSTREALVAKKGVVEEKEFDVGAPLRKKQADETLDLEKRKGEMETDNEIRKGIALAENKAWIKAQMTLANAQESSASRAQAARTMWELSEGQKGAALRDQYLKVMNDPHADPATVARAKHAWSSFSIKPAEADRIDATNAAAGMREAGNEIVRLQGMMKDQIPGTPGYAALERRLANAEASHDAFTQRVKELTGTTTPAKRKVAIHDRFKSAENTDVPTSQSREPYTVKPSRPIMPRGTIEPGRLSKIRKQQIDYEIFELQQEVAMLEVHGSPALRKQKEARLEALEAQRNAGSELAVSQGSR